MGRTANPNPTYLKHRASGKARVVVTNHDGKRTEILIRMQQILYERVIGTHLWQLAFINGVGPRVEESGFGLIPGFAYTGPFEDITLKGA